MAEITIDKEWVREAVQPVIDNVKANYIPKSVIDDIRAEIISLRNALEDYGQMDEVHALNFALQIIDKHMKGDKE